MPKRYFIFNCNCLFVAVVCVQTSSHQKPSMLSKGETSFMLSVVLVQLHHGGFQMNSDYKHLTKLYFPMKKWRLVHLLPMWYQFFTPVCEWMSDLISDVQTSKLEMPWRTSWLIRLITIVTVTITVVTLTAGCHMLGSVFTGLDGLDPQHHHITPGAWSWWQHIKGHYSGQPRADSARDSQDSGNSRSAWTLI